MRNRTNMRKDDKNGLTMCKILFRVTENELQDSEPDLIVVSFVSKLFLR